MIKKIKFEDEVQIRIDIFLAKNLENISRSRIQKLIEGGFVKVSEEIILNPARKLKSGCEISIYLPDKEEHKPLKQKEINLDIIYEDDSIYILNKRPGIIVHPSENNEEDTIINGILAINPSMASEFADSERPMGVVHRLDKDTSGCLIAAKTLKAQNFLVKLFAERTVRKTYLAITSAIPKEKEGRIDTFFGRHPVNRKKMAVLKDSPRRAVSEYKILQEGLINGRPCALIEVLIETGRTHQIRVHLAHIKAPVLGDKIYGGKQEAKGIKRQLLHAWKISFLHPDTRKEISFEAPLPEDFQNLFS
jgi:23S rRNA pseudouridine1911/1915/1917 synthase